jgi:hypothetical protein
MDSSLWAKIQLRNKLPRVLHVALPNNITYDIKPALFTVQNFHFIYQVVIVHEPISIIFSTYFFQCYTPLFVSICDVNKWLQFLTEVKE